MGKRSQILLVAVLLLLGLAAFFTGWLPSSPVRHTDVVQAEDYASFWIWGGVKPQPVLAQAESLYILQGEVAVERQRTKLTPQGMAVARLRKGEIWLVYRVNTLDWPPEIMPQIAARLNLWRLSGNPVIGLQIDFDAGTRQLRKYAAFLRQVRQELPAEYRFSITGLLDWTSNGDIGAINQLKRIVDEVVIQTYQGKKTVPNYSSYLRQTGRLTLPFKIGLVQGGTWQPDKKLESTSWFRGYVVFLQNSRP